MMTSIYLLTPITPEAKEWIEENVSEDSQWLGNGLAVEPRYLSDLVSGMSEDGLILSEDFIING
mgnify:CR=1 FL=1